MMQKQELNSVNTKILVCCHKQCELPDDDIFLPVQVGASLTDSHWGIQRDDQLNGMPCDNISEKNKSYCEMTAVYWAWKNIKKLYPELQYIGISHYRRFFSLDEKMMFSDLIVKPEDSIKNYKINRIRLLKLLQRNSIIIAKEKQYPYSLMIDYSVNHISDDIKILKGVINDIAPEYKNAFYQVMIRNNKLSHYNMNIMSITDFDKYCEWLFSILFEMENRINIENYNPVQKRIWGYFAERLLNVWIYKNYPGAYRCNVYKYDNNSFNLSFAKRLYSHVKFGLSSFFLKPIQKSESDILINAEKQYLKMIEKK